MFGYWLVADAQALYVATGLGEWAGALPGFGAGMMRNFITAEAVSDRLFSLLVFLHIGTALFVLLVLWIHLQRLVRAAGPGSLYVFAREARDPRNQLSARSFAPDAGVAEDPATGSMMSPTEMPGVSS